MIESAAYDIIKKEGYVEGKREGIEEGKRREGLDHNIGHFPAILFLQIKVAATSEEIGLGSWPNYDQAQERERRSERSGGGDFSAAAGGGAAVRETEREQSAPSPCRPGQRYRVSSI